MSMPNSGDIQKITYILDYCKLIEECFIRFGKSFDFFESDAIYRAAVCMCQLHIGEISIHLSDKFKEQYKLEIPWEQIRGLRHVLAHNYYSIKAQMIWDISTIDVPELRKFCEDILSENQNP